MDTFQYLFPSELEVTPTNLKKILLIGSCLSDMYGSYFRHISKGLIVDRIVFNNAHDLPAKPPSDISEYDLQYVQIPLRSVLTDAIINADNLRSSAFHRELLVLAKHNIDIMLKTALTYNTDSGILTFVSNFVVPQVRISPSLFSDHTELDITDLIVSLNRYLAIAIKGYKNVVYADVDMIASSLGKRFFLDDPIYFYTHGTAVLPHAAEFERFPSWSVPERARIEDIPDMTNLYENRIFEYFRAVFRQIEAGFRIVNQIDMVKVVIFDLDNTLWRGQLAEHYQPGRERPPLDGWPTGIWEAVQQLRWRGIITSIASKNDHALVEERWFDAVGLRFAKLTDFVHAQINWQPKAESVGKILRALNLTAKSAVFVDDNPVERESVRAAFPDIRTIGSNPLETRRILLWSAETQIANISQESIRREDMLRGQIIRETEKASMSREDFLNSLDCRISFLEIKNTAQQEFARTLELVNKTNQFNTTGERWTVVAVNEFLRDGGRVISFSLKDRFVEYGLIGVLFVKTNTIHQFVMSCRVLGMGAEEAAIRELVTMIRESHGRVTIVGRLIETESNGPSRDVYSRAGFQAGEDKTLFNLLSEASGPKATHVRAEWPDLVS